MKNERLKKLLDRVNVIGVINTLQDASYAARWPRNADIFELRFDRFIGDEIKKNMAIRAVERLRAKRRPIILTIRHKLEGGAADIGNEQRIRLFSERAYLADLIDMEACSLLPLEDALAQIRKKQQIGLIASYHDLVHVPDAGRVQQALAEADRYGADVFKVAVKADTLEELESFMCIIRSLQVPKTMRIAPMAMGKAGKISRLFYGWSGSPLVYGYLKDKLVPGQMQVSDLRKALDEIAQY